jgi:hypothetical protein
VKIRDLIEELSHLDQDSLVVIDEDGLGYGDKRIELYMRKCKPLDSKSYVALGEGDTPVYVISRESESLLNEQDAL